jgi:hypothetical protein
MTAIKEANQPARTQWRYRISFGDAGTVQPTKVKRALDQASEAVVVHEGIEGVLSQEFNQINSATVLVSKASIGASKLLGKAFETRIDEQAIGADERAIGADKRETTEVLDTLYQLDKSDVRMAIDLLFDYFNECFRGRRFDACKRILTNVDVGRISSTSMVAFLSISLPIKQFHARQTFFERVYKKLVDERGKDRAERLLNKYK